MKSTNDKMTWNTQDMNLSSYVSKANADHTISGQGTGIHTLDHSATTPRLFSIICFIKLFMNTLIWIEAAHFSYHY